MTSVAVVNVIAHVIANGRTPGCVDRDAIQPFMAKSSSSSPLAAAGDGSNGRHLTLSGHSSFQRIQVVDKLSPPQMRQMRDALMSAYPQSRAH
jgi:hypothetical protein